MYCIVGLSLAVHTVSYRIISYSAGHLPYVLYCSRFVSCRTVLYSPRKYRTIRGSYVLCRVSRTCMYCIVGLSLVVRIASYRIVLYCVSGRTVSILNSRGSCSDRIILFPGLCHDFSRAVLYETYGTIGRRHDTIRGA
jgi:hypothetical protein